MKTQLSLSDCRALVTAWQQQITQQREDLILRDQWVGDGDLGITMQKAFNAAAEVEPAPQSGIEQFFIQCGMAMAKAAPSTMGTLMATGFMRGGKALLPGSQLLDASSLALFFNAFSQGIAERGKAQPGDKTVLDVLQPASQALALAASHQHTLAASVDAAYRAAQQGLAATKEMVPQHGKAACFVEKSAGTEDPGGTVALILFQVLAEFINP